MPGLIEARVTSGAASGRFDMVDGRQAEQAGDGLHHERFRRLTATMA